MTAVAELREPLRKWIDEKIRELPAVGDTGLERPISAAGAHIPGQGKITGAMRLTVDVPAERTMGGGDTGNVGLLLTLSIYTRANIESVLDHETDADALQRLQDIEDGLEDAAGLLPAIAAVPVERGAFPGAIVPDTTGWQAVAGFDEGAVARHAGEAWWARVDIAGAASNDAPGDDPARWAPARLWYLDALEEPFSSQDVEEPDPDSPVFRLDMTWEITAQR